GCTRVNRHTPPARGPNRPGKVRPADGGSPRQPRLAGPAQLRPRRQDLRPSRAQHRLGVWRGTLWPSRRAAHSLQLRMRSARREICQPWSVSTAKSPTRTKLCRLFWRGRLTPMARQGTEHLSWLSQSSGGECHFSASGSPPFGTLAPCSISLYIAYVYGIITI